MVPWIILALISMCEVTLPLAITSNESDLAPSFGTCTFVRPLKGLFWHWAFWQNPKNMRQSSTSFIISENKKNVVEIWEINIMSICKIFNMRNESHSNLYFMFAAIFLNYDYIYFYTSNRADPTLKLYVTTFVILKSQIDPI